MTKERGRGDEGERRARGGESPLKRFIVQLIVLSPELHGDLVMSQVSIGLNFSWGRGRGAGGVDKKVAVVGVAVGVPAAVVGRSIEKQCRLFCE
jgi:hypothetical protein